MMIESILETVSRFGHGRGDVELFRNINGLNANIKRDDFHDSDRVFRPVF